MSEASYGLDDITIRESDPNFERFLEYCHAGRKHPLCLCCLPHPSMYVAKVWGKYVVKRMPSSGRDHAPSCGSYEPPPELSGLAQVQGSAIQEDMSGMTTLKLSFSLSRGASRQAPVAGATERDSVKDDGNKLTLRGTLHYLWEAAGFHMWSPAMEGKRNWAVIYQYLNERVAKSTLAKGMHLSDVLYIPEPFYVHKKEEIDQRRFNFLNKASRSPKGSRRLLLVVGEIKRIDALSTGQGYQVSIKQTPLRLTLSDQLYQRMNKRFDAELALHHATDGSHLILIGTAVYNSSTGTASFEELALMVVTDNWLPFENMFEKAAIDTLIQQKRYFKKGLRYNLPSSRPLASILVTDTKPQPTALYIIPPDAANDAINTLDLLLKESTFPSWVWHVDRGPIPPIPEKNSIHQQTMESVP